MSFFISTSDNPYDYFTEFDEWLAWDYPRYNTLGLLDRIMVSSDDLPDSLIEQDTDEAIEIILKENWYGVHIKVEGPSKED